MSKALLITGGAGFVGSSLAISLKQRFRDWRITALDNLHRSGSQLNLPRLREAGILFLHGDIRCREDLESLVVPPDLIIECSAEPSAQAGYGDSPQYLIQTNLQGCFNCLELARRVKADFIFVSTSRVYPTRRLNELAFREEESRFVLCEEQSTAGASARGINEDFPLDGPRSLYGMTKLASELMVTEYADAYGLRSIINRCGLIAGPWQMGRVDQGVAVLWMVAHYFKRELSYIGFGGEGKQVRDILHIQDLCDLLIDQVSEFDRYAGRMFNVGGGLSFSLSLCEMTALCQEITGNRVRVGSILENRPSDVRIYITDYRQLSKFSSWHPRRDPRATFTEIYDWMRAEEDALKPVLLAQVGSR